MAVETGSTVPRRQIGRLLRQLRERAGLSLMAAAVELEFSRARMYRIENGEVSLRRHDVLALCAVYGAPAELAEVLVGLARESKSKGWWHAYGDVVPAWFELYVGMENAAERLRHYAPSVIPGLLQNREYAECVFRQRTDLDDSGVRNAVAVRLERQWLLRREHPRPPRLDVIVDEGVLRRAIADTLGMQKQLAHLVNVSQRPGVGVRVVPFSAGPHRASSAGSFTILDFPTVGAAAPEPTTIYCEKLTGALYLDKPREVETYCGIWSELEQVALDRHASDDLIATIIKESDG
ncbi:helix-turn-helix transcriptional regulator [Amorphoplanes nipponensis]|uniref:Transcriptional regulator n=1 Tax=Actinoplanes nipponensis TaxID=135950 RepID=A0A919JG77_9ACTN|nr:helix-turn-helix transcriptional regulator [Actinoplanes nipponensis]GIE48447.1 transcriptional regulator [Actinoplanes nipponensis]